ncbi:MAG TPA: STAS domain-containing protein [Burkholderiales bacterium]|nr:STAS domain-containing protein [Burkholderiales bacterium]
MIRREGERLVLDGPVTLANVAGVLEEGRRCLAEGVRTVDLAEVSELDSSLLALLIAWKREAGRRAQPLDFVNLPESLQTIARLYGVSGLLAPAVDR